MKKSFKIIIAIIVIAAIVIGIKAFWNWANETKKYECEIEEIQNKINAIEEIVNSKDSKSKKWSKAKEIVKWIADKGVDVGITLLPLLLKMS